MSSERIAVRPVPPWVICLYFLAKTANCVSAMIAMSCFLLCRGAEPIRRDQHRAQREPVKMTRRGRPVAYVIAEHGLKGLRDLNQRREAAVYCYASYRASAVSRLEGAALDMGSTFKGSRIGKQSGH